MGVIDYYLRTKKQVQSKHANSTDEAWIDVRTFVKGRSSSVMRNKREDV